MNKFFVSVFSLVAIVSQAQASLMPEGRFTGKGRWTDHRGQSGSYQVDVTIEAKTFVSTYVIGGKTETLTYEIRPLAGGRFALVAGGKRRGEGYCMSVQCHYRIAKGGARPEETLTFYQDGFYRLGSKRVGGQLISWEEAMTKEAR